MKSVLNEATFQEMLLPSSRNIKNKNPVCCARSLSDSSRNGQFLEYMLVSKVLCSPEKERYDNVKQLRCNNRL